MKDADSIPYRLVAILDMGASAVRLVIGEVAPKRPPRILEEASRGVLLGRDSFASGVIKTATAEAALAAVDGFRKMIESYKVTEIRAVATSAVREARNGEIVLDRIRGRTGITFDVINEAEQSRLMHLAVKHDLGRHASLKAAWTLVVEVGGGNTGLSLLRHGEPVRSGVYGIGSVRMRQELDVRRHAHDVQTSLLRRFIATAIEEIRQEIPLRQVTNVVAIGGDVRFAAAQVAGAANGESVRDVPREAFMTICHDLSRLDEEQLIETYRLSAVEAETLVPALLVNRALIEQTAARHVVISEASLRMGVMLDLAEPGGRMGAEDFERQVLTSAESVGERFHFDADHGKHVATLATSLFDQLREEHQLGNRERLLLQVASLLHDVGIYVSLQGHHEHSQYLLGASQIFGLSNDEMAVVANIARYHRKEAPQTGHLPYVELDRQDRVIVSKLAAILRVANALDAEHLQKVTKVKLEIAPRTWILDIEGSGDVTMECLAATARADMFTEIYGRPLQVRTGGGVS